LGAAAAEREGERDGNEDEDGGGNAGADESAHDGDLLGATGASGGDTRRREEVPAAEYNPP
jgi:hypothetical protein